MTIDNCEGSLESIYSLGMGTFNALKEEVKANPMWLGIAASILALGVGLYQAMYSNSARFSIPSSRISQNTRPQLKPQIPSPIFSPSISIISSSPPELQASPERMRLLGLLLNKTLIISFLNHPKTMDYFLDEMKRKEDFCLSEQLKVQQLMEKFPKNPEIARFVHFYNLDNKSFPLKDIDKELFLFLGWGIVPFSYSDEIPGLHDIQIKLFKNYLSREGIAYDDALEEEIELFSQNCSNDFFSKFIGPLMTLLRSHDLEINDLVSIIEGSDDWEKLSLAQNDILEKIYDPQCPENRLGRIHRCYDDTLLDLDQDEDDLTTEYGMLLLKKEIGELLENIEDQINDEIEQEFPGFKKWDKPSDVQEGCAAVQSFIDKNKSQKFFSREKMIGLFFEVIKELYPEYIQFLEEVQLAGVHEP
ncbi:MAG: hypothetical protein ACHQUC_04595 [Chlamydiales bacterium]